MIEKRAVRDHKAASFAPHATRNTLVFKRGRAGRWCKTQRILQLSSMFAHLDAIAVCKCLATRQLLNRPRAQHAFKIRAARTNGRTIVGYGATDCEYLSRRTARCLLTSRSMQRSIPHFLYKYRPVDANALAMLASDKVYMSRLDAFNDPFEALNLDPTLEPKLAEQQHGTFAVSKQPVQADAVGNSLRACSLSEECQDLLMWGHYADRHRGFCIRFEFRNDAELSKLLYPIEYNPRFPELDNKIDQSLETALSSTLTKSEKWSYEREWRIVGRVSDDGSTAGELFATYRPQAITGIIFGVRTPELHKQLIHKVLQDRRVEYLQAEKQSQNFALLIRPAKEK
jgi:hypothetical protein